MTDIFNDPTKGTPGGEATPPNTNHSEQLGTLLSSIKNERGEPKYRTVEDALVALQHSQNFIPQLRQENDLLKQRQTELEQSQARMATLEEEVRKLTQGTARQDNPPATVDQEVLATLVKQTITAEQTAQLAKANQQKVAKAITDKFGAEKAGELFYGKAAELGFSADEINTLAGKSPEAALRLVGISEAPAYRQGTTPPSGSVRTDAFQGNPQSLIGRETTALPLGATAQDHQRLMDNARGMVTELEQHGLTIKDLEDPTNFFKYMK